MATHSSLAVVSNMRASSHLPPLLTCIKGSGIGRACALGLARDGAAAVFVADLDIEAAERVAEECRAAATAASFRSESFHIDISQGESVEKATKHMVATFGRIDYCINCAGVNRTFSFFSSHPQSGAYIGIDWGPNAIGHIRGRFWRVQPLPSDTR